MCASSDTFFLLFDLQFSAFVASVIAPCEAHLPESAGTRVARFETVAPGAQTCGRCRRDLNVSHRLGAGADPQGLCCVRANAGNSRNR